MSTPSVFSPYARERPFYDAVARETFYGPRLPVELAPAPDDTFHTWREGDRLPLLAHRHWGEPRLWWLLCDLNDLVDPEDLEVGTVLRIPSRARVEALVLG